MAIYTKGGSIDAVVNDTSVTGGVYTSGSALRVRPVSGTAYVGKTAPDGSTNVVSAFDGLRGLYHPSGAIRANFSNQETALSGLYHRSGALNMYTSVSNATLSILGEPNAFSLDFLDNTSDTVTSGVSVKSTATGTITFTRASLATVTDSDGNIKWAPHNLLLASEQFDASNWTKSAVSVTANNVVAPNNTTTADTIIENNALAFHNINIAVSVPIGTVRQRVYAKLGSGTRFLQMRPLGVGTGVSFANFDLSNGTVVSGGTGGSAFVSASVTPADNGYYLCEMVSNYATAPTGVNFVMSNGSTENPSYTGDNTSSIILWGAHLYRSDLGGMVANTSAYPMYNPTTAAAYHGPRLDFDPVTQAARGLLVEEQRTNLLLRSQEFETSSWTKSQTSATANATIAPDGLTTAEKIIENTAAGVHSVQQTVTVQGNTRYCLSVYAKAAERSWIVIDPVYPAVANNITYFDLQNGVVGTNDPDNTASITSVGNGWYRCEVRHTTQSAQTSMLIQIATATGNNGIGYTGNGTSGVFLWGAQLEAGLFPTSYIPTGASTVTRSADVATVATSTFPYNVNSSSLVIAASQLSELAVSSWTQSLDNGTGNDRFITIIGPNRPVNTQMTSSLVGQFNQSITPTSTTTPFKHAFAYELNNANMAVNGVLGTDDTTVTPPAAAATTLRIGTNTIQSIFFNGHIRQITYLPRRISNAELQARTL